MSHSECPICKQWTALTIEEHIKYKHSSQERGSTPKLVQESGWQSDGQIGATGSKI